MGLVSCTGCDRKHDRPVNSRCPYLKSAIAKCVVLGVSSDDYKFYLPEIGSLDIDSEITSTAFPLMADDIMAILQDNAECKRQLMETQRQLAHVLGQLDSMSLNVVTTTTAVITPASTAPLYSSSPFTFPPSTTTWSTNMRGQLAGQPIGAQVPISQHIPASYAMPIMSTSQAPVRPPPGFVDTASSQLFATDYARAIPWQSCYNGIPNAGLIGRSAATTVMGSQPQGHQAWMQNVASRASEPDRATWNNLVGSTVPGYIPSSSQPAAPSSMDLGHGAFSQGCVGRQPAGQGQGITTDPLPPWPSTHSASLQDPLLGHPVNITVDAAGIKAASKRRKCVIFDVEPHLYVDNVKSASIEDVISAELSMLESMLGLGMPIQNFAKHIRFLTDKVRIYNGSALLRYDSAVREKAEILGPSVFVYGDHELVHAHLGMDALKPKSKSTKESVGSVGSKSTRRPRGVCWKFNEAKGCKRETCQWKHECRDCSGEHSFFDCKVKK